MYYWEDFFILDKIQYPVGASIVMGILYLALSYFADLAFSEELFYLCIGVGFLIGNFLKTEVLQKKRKLEAKLRKAKRKKSAQ